MSQYSYITVSFLIFLLLPTPVLSDISVQDMLVLKGEETMLCAKTTGKFFPQGGKLVEFFVNGKSLGKSLSGGDGIAYKQFTPQKTGLFHISVKSDDDESKGLLLFRLSESLTLKKGDKVIFIDVVGSLFEGLFSRKPRERSQEVITQLSKRFSVVFLQTGLLNTKLLKSWLKEHKFVDLPILLWQKGLIFDETIKKGLKIKAIIGNKYVIESAKEYKPRLFSFEEAEDAEIVNEWGKIGEFLLKKKKSSYIDRTDNKNK